MGKEQEIFNLTTKQIEAIPPKEVVEGKEALSSAEAVQSQETMEAEQIAREKLEKLMQEDFKDFAIRFMNINEYRKMVKSAVSYKRELKRRQEFIYEVGAGEVYVPKLEEGMEHPTFREYLERSMGNWLYTAAIETDWPQGVEGKDKAYTLAVIFGLSLVDLTWREKRFGTRGYAWGAIRPEVKRREFGGNLLGSIAITGNIPAQELIELSSKSGKLAHPVFNSYGVVRWPKALKEEAEKEIFDLDEKKFVPKNE